MHGKYMGPKKQPKQMHQFQLLLINKPFLLISAQPEETSIEGSMLSFFSDEGLDLSQHTLTDTMFVGPDLDQDGEEVITGTLHDSQLFVYVVVGSVYSSIKVLK